MKHLKNILCLTAAVLAFGVGLNAQSLIRVVEDVNATQSVSLDGKAEAVFVSNSENLFIESSRPSLDTKKNSKKNSAGMWEYTIELQLQTQEGTASGRTFTITQSGSANKTTFKKGKFAANHRYYFRVESVKNPIFLVDNTQATDVHLKNGEAVVEINSIIDVEIITDPRLNCEIERKKTQAGYYSKSVIINMKELDDLRNAVQRQQMIYEDLNESLLERAERNEEVRDSEWYSLSQLQESKEESEAKLADVSMIRITAKDANELVIDISDLQAKQKKVYTVETMGGSKEQSKSHWLLLANYGFSTENQNSFGLTVGWVSKFGWYVNIMTDGSFKFDSDQTATLDDDGVNNDYLWSGDVTKARFSATVGGLFAIKKLGYVYAGMGYGIRNLVWHTMTEQTVAITPGTYKGIATEAGIIFNIGEHVLLSGGTLVQFPGAYCEFKLGLGYKF